MAQVRVAEGGCQQWLAACHHGFEAGQLLKVVHQRLQAVDALLLHKAKHRPPQGHFGSSRNDRAQIHRSD